MKQMSTISYIFAVIGGILWLACIRELAPDLPRFSVWFCIRSGIGAIAFLSVGTQIGFNSRFKPGSEGKKDT